jgi:hypothetical protein
LIVSEVGYVDGSNFASHGIAVPVLLWPKKVSKIDRGRPATSVHGFVLAVFRARARAQRSGARARARARSIKQLYHSILVNALIGQEFGNG